MSKYLFIVSFKVEGVQGILKEGGTARRAVVEKMAEDAGGSVESFYFAFGGEDVYSIVDLPDDETAAAAALTIAATGRMHIKTIVLLTPEQIDAASKKTVNYRPPGG